MANERIQIRNTAIDSNNWVDLKNVSFTPSYAKTTNADPLQGTLDVILPEEDIIGVENPVFTIQLVFDANEYTSNTDLWSETPSTVSGTTEDGLSLAGYVTLGYLQALWRNRTGETYIKINFGNPESQKQWRNYNNTSDEIRVTVKGINPSPEVDSVGNHFLRISINCQEVSPDGTLS